MHHASLLQRSPQFRALWLARTVSFWGDIGATTALVVYAYGLRGAGTTVALVLLAQALPRLFGPVAGGLADRLDQRRLMVWCDGAQAVVWLCVALLLPPLPLLLVLVFCAATLATIFMPAGRSALPALVSSGDLGPANALLSIGVNTGLALGPALGGMLIGWIGVRGVLIINAATFAVSAWLLARLPVLPPVPTGEHAPASLFAATRAGLLYLAQHSTARAVGIGLVLVVSFAALDNVALVALAQHTLGTGAAGYGGLASAYGVGMVLGPLLVLRWSSPIGGSALLLGGTALLGVGTLATGVAPTFAVAILTQAVAGAGNGLQNIGNDTLLQRTVPRAMLGRVFGTVGSGAFLASSLAYALGGPLLDWTSPRTTFVIAGSGVLAALVIVWRLLPHGSAAYTEHRH